MKKSIVALLLLSSFSFGVFANPFVGVTVGTGKIEDSGFVDNFTFKAGLEESNVKYKGEKISAPAGYVGVNYTF
ncbi:hypothetical protein LRP50_04250 [Enterovibrio sp. ZSDZ42]|uniref:Outer membrane protein beta-barrel domain-containing protein n=1 Tax=Enterovibrio gelatinilyticus TaxID=2899819 RepID=A0ABT5QWE2_9GAMM|nr:hypothetical protein [Enterovibrio sp. ZSDZ42]MDD1792336.1 hypothetical protein [Enterovibrio sp. ZSDZ42]